MTVTDTGPTLADVTDTPAAITVDGDIVAVRIDSLSLPPWGTITEHRFDGTAIARAGELASQVAWNERQLCAVDITGPAVLCTLTDYATNYALSETGDLTSTVGGVGVSGLVRSADGYWAFPTRSARCDGHVGAVVATVGETAGPDDVRGDTWVGTRTLRRGLAEEVGLGWHDVDVTWTGATRAADGGIDFTALVNARQLDRSDLEGRFATAVDAWERDGIRWVHDDDLDNLCSDPAVQWAGWGAVAALDALRAVTGRHTSGRLAVTPGR